MNAQPWQSEPARARPSAAQLLHSGDTCRHPFECFGPLVQRRRVRGEPLGGRRGRRQRGRAGSAPTRGAHERDLDVDGDRAAGRCRSAACGARVRRRRARRRCRDSTTSSTPSSGSSLRHPRSTTVAHGRAEDLEVTLAGGPVQRALLGFELGRLDERLATWRTLAPPAPDARRPRADSTPRTACRLPCSRSACRRAVRGEAAPAHVVAAAKQRWRDLCGSSPSMPPKLTPRWDTITGFDSLTARRRLGTMTPCALRSVATTRAIRSSNIWRIS